MSAKPTLYSLRPANTELEESVDSDRSCSPKGFWIFSPSPYLSDSVKWLGFTPEMVVGDECLRLAVSVLVVHIVSS